jgi:flagellar biosynthesis anti-sigma factor FlgM
MHKRRKKRPGKSSPAAKHNRKSIPGLGPLRSSSVRGAHLARNNNLIDQVRQIIEATPEVRPERVGPLKEAVEQGTYEIDARKLANIFIAELILKR